MIEQVFPIESRNADAAAPNLDGYGASGATSFAASLGAAIDGAAQAVAVADGAASAIAAGRGNIADAAVARAKADTMLEVLAVAASRINGALSTLMQTQI